MEFCSASIFVHNFSSSLYAGVILSFNPSRYHGVQGKGRVIFVAHATILIYRRQFAFRQATALASYA
jgi:hypothetical protein